MSVIPTLFLIGTPIGNRGDMSARAIETLNNVSVIFCEDTRHSKPLLRDLDIQTPLQSFHQGSNPEKVLRELEKEQSVALISDAGMPTISDPGNILVSKVWEAGYLASPIAGPSAFLLALVGSGLPSHHFSFLGFPPQKKGRQTFFQSLVEKEETTIFYESCHRIMKCLNSLAEHLPDRQIVVAKELTKMHEQFFHGTASVIIEQFESDPKLQKGEFVVLLAPNH